MGSERVASADLLAVTDTGPVIVLAELDAIELLNTVDTLLIPQAVLDELQASQAESRVETLTFEPVEAPESAQFETLDPGERAALLIAAEHEDAIVLTDDMAARQAAIEHDIEVHGSVGLIVLAFSHGDIDYDRAVELLRGLQSETSLFVTETIIERGIELLEQQHDQR